MAEQTYHRPVLLDQTIDALGIRPDGIYLDGTAGGGGHSHAIASRLTTGRLISLDQDPDAIAEAGARLRGLPATLVQTNFVNMRQVLDELGIPGVDGILLNKNLIAKAGLEKPCLIIGAGRRAEIWNPAVYEQVMEDMTDDKLEEEFIKYGF